MQNDTLARQVHRIIGSGLELKARLERGERPVFDAEQAKLRGLLYGEGELLSLPDYVGETAQARERVSQMLRGTEPFLGARYALACWLDEVFITDSPWSALWTAASMEVAILQGGTQERAWRFWQQAQKAEARPGSDALEVYLWCVMLGFRGDPADAQIDPAQWAERARRRVLAGRAQDFSLPPEKDPPTYVPVLRGRDRFGGMLRAAAALAALAAGVAVFLLVKYQAH
jgi:type VI secretion system protein ImpK